MHFRQLGVSVEHLLFTRKKSWDWSHSAAKGAFASRNAKRFGSPTNFFIITVMPIGNAVLDRKFGGEREFDIGILIRGPVWPLLTGFSGILGVWGLFQAPLAKF